MTSSQRPLSVTVLSGLYIAIGSAGFVYHFREFLSRGGSWQEISSIEITEAIAIVAGVFMLRGQNWARWLAIAWVAFHLVLTVFHHFRGFAIHVLIFAGITWLLVRADAAEYVRDGGTESQ
jgi:hypothetical protein